jgi:transcriptional regulator with XRE-family HTH domain
MSDVMQELGRQLRDARRQRSLRQPDLAARVGRQPSRISELEQDLLKGRLGRDRLTLLAEICDALDLRLQLVSKHDQRSSPRTQGARSGAATQDPFDELFLDLSDGED